MTNHPSSWELVSLWLSMHFAGQPAVIFADILGCSDVASILAHFRTSEEKAAAVNGQYSILPCKTVEDAIHICNKVPDSDSDPFTFVWDGTRIVHENT